MNKVYHKCGFPDTRMMSAELFRSINEAGILLYMNTDLNYLAEMEITHFPFLDLAAKNRISHPHSISLLPILCHHVD